MWAHSEDAQQTRDCPRAISKTNLQLKNTSNVDASFTVHAFGFMPSRYLPDRTCRDEAMRRSASLKQVAPGCSRGPSRSRGLRGSEWDVSHRTAAQHQCRRRPARGATQPDQSPERSEGVAGRARLRMPGCFAVASRYTAAPSAAAAGLSKNARSLERPERMQSLTIQ